MTLALRRTVVLDGERRPDDYEVRHDGQTVGLTACAAPAAGYGDGNKSDGDRGGGADNLAEAKAAFRAAVGGAPRPRARRRADRRQRALSSEKADEKCSVHGIR
jgi:hypothetical protein